MIDDELRSVLADRADGLPDNPARVAEVRSRIRGTRRRRTAGTALALVLLALTGLALTRLPGRPDALPTGVSPGPWFRPNGFVDLPGFSQLVSLPAPYAGPTELYLTARVAPPLRYLVLAACQQRGVLTVSRVGGPGPAHRIDCSRPAGDRYEGVLELSPDQAAALFLFESSGEATVRLEPDFPGEWTFAVVESVVADTLVPWREPAPPLVDGARTPAGATVRIDLARRSPDVPWGVFIYVDCTPSVRLELTVPAGRLLAVDCDPKAWHPGLAEYRTGQLGFYVDGVALEGLGLRPGQQVPLTVRVVGPPTDRWRIASVR